MYKMREKNITNKVAVSERVFEVFAFASCLFVLFLFFVQTSRVNELTQLQKEQYEANKQCEQELEATKGVLQAQIDVLEHENRDLKDKVKELESVEEEISVQDVLGFSEEEQILFAKFIAYTCNHAPNATRVYVGCAVINSMYNGKIGFMDAVNSLGYSQSDFENIKYESVDMTAVLKVLVWSISEVQETSSGATFFCEDENYQKYIEKGMQVLFTSGNYTFFADFAVG